MYTYIYIYMYVCVHVAFLMYTCINIERGIFFISNMRAQRL